MKTYSMKIAGLDRQLPICSAGEHLDIAAFIMLSDVEITVASAEELLKIVPEFDVLLTAETKGIPLAYEMSRQCGKKYYVARKSVKLYMTDPVSVKVKSITTEGIQTLYLPKEDAEEITGRRVLIVDDVISTGESLNALEHLVNAVGGMIAGKASVLAEGKAADRDDLIFLGKLPVFPK